MVHNIWQIQHCLPLVQRSDSPLSFLDCSSMCRRWDSSTGLPILESIEDVVAAKYDAEHVS